RPRPPRSWHAKWQGWSTACATWISTRCRAWPRHWTGPARWRRWAPTESMPAWSTPRWGRRSSTRRTSNEPVRPCRRSSRRPKVLPTRPDLLPRLAAFARLLHDAGLDAGPGRLTDAARALNHVDLRQQDDFRSALRTV